MEEPRDGFISAGWAARVQAGGRAVSARIVSVRGEGLVLKSSQPLPLDVGLTMEIWLGPAEVAHAVAQMDFVLEPPAPRCPTYPHWYTARLLFLPPPDQMAYETALLRLRQIRRGRLKIVSLN